MSGRKIGKEVRREGDWADINKDHDKVLMCWKDMEFCEQGREKPMEKAGSPGKHWAKSGYEFKSLILKTIRSHRKTLCRRGHLH